MPESQSRFNRLLEELKRRKVLQTGAAYAFVAWIILQFGEVTFEPLHFPDWVLTALVVLVIAGFPVVLLLSWFFNFSFRGIRREAESGQISADDETQQVRSPGPSIAVLAFDDLSPDKDQDYLCDGIAEEILNRLAQIKRLRVASRTSSFQFKAQPADASTIGQRLNVQTLLEGSVRKAGKRLRVTIQLINAADGFNLWSNSYDRELADIFEIQDAIASNVAAALEVTLTRSKPDDGTTQNAQAYEYYLKGLHYFHRWGMRNVEYAIDMFARAVEIDPAYARAWAALGDGHSMVCMYWDATAEHLDAAAAASDQALELAPELAEAHVSGGLSHFVHKRHDEAIAEFETALGLDPDLFTAHYYYARVCFQQGNLERAAELFERAEKVQPDDFQTPILLRQVYRSLGREEEALAAARRGVERAERHLQLNPDDTRALNLGLGGFADLGDRKKLREFATRSLAIDDTNADTLYNVACGYARVGDADTALDYLERAALHGTSIAEWAEQDSDLVQLHKHPRFLALTSRMRSATTENQG